MTLFVYAIIFTANLLPFYTTDGFTLSLLTHFTKPTLSNDTKNTLRVFAPLQDLRDLQLCHVLPFSVIDKKLASTFLDQWDRLKSGDKLSKDVINDLKIDVYKVDGDAAYLKAADVKSKMIYYHENANQKRKLEEDFSKLRHEGSAKSTEYTKTVQSILNLFYNAPANLRVSSDSCFNEGPAMEFEDPNLRTYTKSTHNSLNDTEFTEHSRYLARKYHLSVMKDQHGSIRTTDKKKSELNPELPNSLKEYNKGLNVFQFFSKHFKNRTAIEIEGMFNGMKKREKVNHAGTLSKGQ